jgi:glutathione S-transferase
MNPNAWFIPLVFQAIFTGIVWASLKFANLEAVLAAAIPLPLNANKTLLLTVILAGMLQNHMASTTNWARVKYNVPWPNTFAPEAHKDKVAFDCVQRAHLNFVENYPQVLGVVYFAAQEYPYYAFVTSCMFLLGRLVFANGYYTGKAAAKDAGTFGYMLGMFPLYGLMYIYTAKQFGVPLL